MPDEQLMEIWHRAGAHLDQARRSLTDPGDDAFAQFDEFWHHNERGLALDELAEVARARRAPRVVGEELQAAATVMRLDRGDREHGATVRLISERLTEPEDYAVGGTGPALIRATRPPDVRNSRRPLVTGWLH